MPFPARVKNALGTAQLVVRKGFITKAQGLLIESRGPAAFIGERCNIVGRDGEAITPAEVVGLSESGVVLMQLGEIQEIKLGSAVLGTGQPVEIPVGDALIGRVIDALGNPLDGKGSLRGSMKSPLQHRVVNPLQRAKIDSVVETGVRGIDSLLTMGRGQRVGIFAGSGVGKSTLLGMMARGADADVNVIALIGERGREVLEFMTDVLGDDGLAKSVVVVATADQPALMRSNAALAAMAIAEEFRERKQDVLFIMDSVTRYAMAGREIGLAIGEPPTTRGYTPTVFASLPRLVERAGKFAAGGSITAMFTVLVEGDDDIHDPVADSLRAVLDGHIVLNRDIAQRRLFPAIDVRASLSRLMPQLCTAVELENARKLVEAYATYESMRDMIELGAYRPGSDKATDRIVNAMPEIRKFLAQTKDVRVDRQEALTELQRVVGLLQ